MSPYPKYHLSASASLSFITKAYIKLNIKKLTYRKQWRIVLFMEFLGVHQADKVHTCGEMILILVLLRKKVFQNSYETKNKDNKSCYKKPYPDSSVYPLTNKKCSVLSKLLILHRLISKMLHNFLRWFYIYAE